VSGARQSAVGRIPVPCRPDRPAAKTGGRGQKRARELAPGESITLARPAQLEWVQSGKQKSLYLGGSNGVGGIWSAGAQENLTAGKHSLRISYASVHGQGWQLTTEAVRVEVKTAEKQKASSP
jgi:hypothetical protein